MREPQRIIVERRRIGGIGCGGFRLILFLFGGLQAGWDKLTGNTDEDKAREFQRDELLKEAREDKRVARREERVMDRFRASKSAQGWRVERVEIDGTGLTVVTGLESATKGRAACEFARNETSAKWTGITVVGRDGVDLAEYFDGWPDCLEAGS